MRTVYLDNNATTPVAPEVFEAMRPYILEEFGNASSIHAYGQKARAAVERAREQVARLLKARPSEIVFTSGGTEADNAALLGIVENASGKPKHIVTTTIEHTAVLYTARALERSGVRVTYVRVGPRGVVDPADIEQALRPDTVLISVMHTNNELGTIQPIADIGRMARERDIYFHTDAVQAVGKASVDVEALDVNLLSLSAHKLHGPKGVGVLYVRRGTKLAPLLHGGHDEHDRRPGTENVPGIVGLGMAAELARTRPQTEADSVRALRDRLEEGILDRISGVRVNGDRARRIPTTTNLCFEATEGEALVIALDLKGVACSTGAACSAGSVEPSHVLVAIGRSAQEARGSVRFSLGRFTTDDDIDYTLEVLPPVVERLRSVTSPGGKAVTP